MPLVKGAFCSSESVTKGNDVSLAPTSLIKENNKIQVRLHTYAPPTAN